MPKMNILPKKGIGRIVWRLYAAAFFGRSIAIPMALNTTTFFTDNTFMIALTAIVTKNTNLINIQALLDSVVLELDYQKFTRLFDEYQILERLVRKIIESEWAKKETREIRLVIDDATARYMYFREEHPGLETKIPQYHIASYLGITPIQLSRIRSKLISR